MVENKIVEYASFHYRVLAWGIDMLIIFGIYFILSIFIPQMRYYDHVLCFYTGLLCFYESDIGLMVFLLFGFFYNWLFEVYNKGQTIGKMVLKLRTVDEKTLNLTTPYRYALDSLIRANILLLVDLLLGFLVSNGKSPQKPARYSQGLTKTVVIHANVKK